MAQRAEPDNDLYRDATIQRFEFTYELAHKMLKRYLILASASPETIEQMAFSDLIRTGSQQGLLLGNWEDWRRYRDARGTSSHAYDPAKAAQILNGVPKFEAEARHLLAQLERRTTPP